MSTLLQGGDGAIGLLLASLLVDLFYFFPYDPVLSIAAGIIAMVAPYAVYRFARERYGVECFADQPRREATTHAGIKIRCLNQLGDSPTLTLSSAERGVSFDDAKLMTRKQRVDADPSPLLLHCSTRRAVWLAPRLLQLCYGTLQKRWRPIRTSALARCFQTTATLALLPRTFLRQPAAWRNASG